MPVDAGRRAGHLVGGRVTESVGEEGVGRRSPIPPSRMPDPRWKLQCAINHRRVFTVGAPAEAARPGCLWGVREKNIFLLTTFLPSLVRSSINSSSNLTTFDKNCALCRLVHFITVSETEIKMHMYIRVRRNFRATRVYWQRYDTGYMRYMRKKSVFNAVINRSNKTKRNSYEWS